MSDLPLPSNVQAERLVLGQLLLNYLDMAAIGGTIGSQDFSLDKHRRIFQRMVDVHAAGRKIDRVMLCEELQRHGELEACDGVSYICSLDDGTPEIYDAMNWVRIIREKSILRQAIMHSQSVIQRCLQQDAAVDVLSEAEVQFAELGQSIRPPSSLQRVSEIVEERGAEAILNPGAGSRGACVQLPWAPMREHIPYLMPGDVTVWAARPSVGKSSGVREIAAYNAERGIGTCIYSLEMTKEQVIAAMSATRGQVNIHKMRLGVATEVERHDLIRALNDLSELNLWVNDRSDITVPEIVADVQKLQKQHPIGLLVIDYLQLLSHLGRESNRNNVIGAISRSIKIAANKLNLHIISVSQLNRDAEKQGRRPTMADMRDSGTIEQDANNIIALHRSSEDPNEQYPKVEMLLLKQRSGPIGMTEMAFDRRLTRFIADEKGGF